MTSTKTNRPIRIVMILGSMPPMPIGGAEIQAVQMCRQLKELGIETEIITWGKFWHPRKAIFDGMPFRRLSSFVDIFADLLSLLKPVKKKPATKILYDDKTMQTTAISGNVWWGMRSRYSLFYINALRYLKKRRADFDIIHAHMMEWPAFTAVKLGKRLNKPVVVKDSTMNGIFSLLRYPDGKQKQADIATYAWCIAMTRVIRENMIKAGVPPERISLIPNGIKVQPLPAKTSPWKNRVVFVGNLTQQPAKGIDILLCAWKQVIAKISSATLEIIGSGDIQAYQQFTVDNRIENVRFAGKISNVSAHLLDADIFVLPSRREGMSNALMEAMILGLPVVATKVSGSEDLIESGVSGLLVPVADADALANALIKMLENPEAAIDMGKKGYESVAANCDIIKIAQDYKDLYIKIAGTA